MPTSLIAPFTAIDLAYKTAFKQYLTGAFSTITTTLSAPFLACVTLWIIVQGVLVMRGDIDARRGLTKLISIAIITGLVTTSTIYHDYVAVLFEDAIPSFVQQLGGNMGIPTKFLPAQLDIIFRGGQAAFQKVAAEIPPMDELDSLAFEGAQFVFYFSLWSIFGIYHVVDFR